VRARERLRDTTGDPWDGRTLEWATRSPPPAWNFAALPQVEGLDAFWDAKQNHGGVLPAAQGEGGRPIEMPRGSPLGVVVAFFAFAGGFAMVWHIWWLALAGLGGVIVAGVARAWQTEHEFEVSPAEIEGAKA